jgi:uncharacterized protein DUF262
MAIQIQHGGQKISWFKDRLAEQCLIFKPPFQRNPVWLDKHKAFLVDTVLRKLPIPEVYIQAETDADGKTVYAVVDGQQRIRALLEFARGEVALMDDYSPGRDGQTWDDLSVAERKAFWDYQLVVRDIIGATDADLRDLFQRLNQNTVTLNAQEIRNARYKGAFISIVTELADQPYWAEQKIVTPNEIRRMLDIEYMAELLIGLMHGPQNKKQSLEGMFESYDAALPKKQHWLSRFEETRALISTILPRIGATRWRGKSDYYSLFLVIGALSGEAKISTNRISLARKALERFGQEVTARLSKGQKPAAVGLYVRAYARAVEKAASDRDRRAARHRILIRILKRFFA